MHLDKLHLMWTISRSLALEREKFKQKNNYKKTRIYSIYLKRKWGCEHGF